MTQTIPFTTSHGFRLVERSTKAEATRRLGRAKFQLMLDRLHRWRERTLADLGQGFALWIYTDNLPGEQVNFTLVSNNNGFVIREFSCHVLEWDDVEGEWKMKKKKDYPGQNMG